MARVLSVLLLRKEEKKREIPAKEEWLKLALEFSPIVALDAPPLNYVQKNSNRTKKAKTLEVEGDERFYGVNIDITGCGRLFKGEEAIVSKLDAGLNTLGFSPRLAIAPTLGAAWALSRYGQDRITLVRKEKLKEALKPLPVAALRLPPALESSLEEVNLTRIEHLLNISRKSLLSRFGMDLLHLLNFAVSEEEEPLTPIRIRKPLKAERNFNGLTTQIEAVLKAGEDMLDELLSKLKEEDKNVSRIVLALRAEGTPTQSKEVKLNLPTSSKKHLWNLLQHPLESFQLGFGVQSLTMYFTHLTEIARQNTAYLEVASAKAEMALNQNRDFAELLDSLQKELGEENVLQLNCKETHLPEKSFSYEPFSLVKEKEPSYSLVQTERPSVLFYQPQPIKAMAMLPDRPPFWVKWRGAMHRVKQGSGPERIAPDWWGKDEALFLTRDYFKVQLPTGIWLWIFRELETSRWFIHGAWC